MSKTIDQRVVEMRFDNKHFESNVSTTMSTLDKLKEKLSLSGATKGIENVSAAAKNVDMSGMSKGVETVTARFSALEVMGVTALANLTNSAVEAGKRIISALTIDPIKTGLSEYETKMNAVQVIKANTRSKYTNEDDQMADINEALEELNVYADRTIYNYTQMTDNVGKFVAQGLSIKEATKAVQGMANLAGASGASAQDMARATYQMSQALGGTIKKIDWNSLRNANMATTELKSVLMDFARVEGIDIDGMIADKGTFEDTLEKGWLSGELFTKAMNVYSDVYSEAELRAMGFKDAQIKNFKDLAATANEATTEVKTMGQLWDVLEETAQSGWTQTWEIIFGDFNAAKKLFTGLQNYFSNIINKFSEARNTLLGGALNMSKPWDNIMDKLDKAGFGKIKDIAKTVGEASDKLKYFQDVVNKVWRGDYKNSDTGRYELLEAAGYDHRVVQDLVNKGYKYKITVEDIEASHKKFGLTMTETSKETEKTAESFGTLTDEQLKNAGLTESEIRLYRDLEEEAKKTGKTIDEVADEMSKMDGRTMLIESFKNAWSGLASIFSAIGKAWTEIFPPMSVVKLYSIIKGIKDFSENLVMSKDTADNLKRTLKGVFAIIDIITTILGGGLKIAFKIITSILGYFNLDILEATALVGDAIVKFRDWFDSLFDISGALDVIVPWVKKAAEATGKWFGSLKESKVFKAVAEWVKDAGIAIKDWFVNIPYAEIFDKLVAGFKKVVSVIKGIGSAIAETKSFGRFIDAIKNAGSAIKDWFSSLKDSDNIPRDIILGLVNGLKNGAGMVFDAIVGIGQGLLTKLKDVLGIHSPSTEGVEIGKNIILGIFNGIKDFTGMLFDLVLSTGKKIIEIVKNLDLGSVLTILMGVGSVIGFVKIANALDNITSPLDELGDVLDAFQGTLKSLSLAVKAEAIKSLAIAIAILAGSIIALSFIKPANLWGAIGAIAALMVMLGALSFFVGKFGSGEGVQFGKIALTLLGLSVSMLIMAAALKTIGSIPEDKIVTTFAAFAGMMVAIWLTFGAISKAGSFEGVGSTLTKMATAMLLMVIVAKIAGSMDKDEMIKGGAALGAFAVIIVGIMAATNLVARSSKKIANIGESILKIATAMLLMTVVAKIAGNMKEDELKQGLMAIIAFGVIIGAFMLLGDWLIGGNDLESISKSLIKVSAAMLIMVVVAKIAGSMSVGELSKGIGAIIVFGIIIGALMVLADTLIGFNELDGVCKAILAVSVAIGLMALTAAILGMMDPAKLAVGTAFVAAFAFIIGQLILATERAQNVTGTIVAITAAIAVLAISIGVLSMLDPLSLITPTLAMAALMGMFALILKMGSNVKSSMGVLIVMTVAIGVLAGALYLIGQLPVANALAASGALSILLVVLSGVILGFSKIGVNIANALLGVVSLTLMAIPLLAFVGVLALMQNVNNAINNAMALTLLATALTVLLIPLTLVGALIGPALLGVAALTLMAVPLLAFVGVLALMQGIENAEANVNLLIKLMTVMTTMLLITGLVAPLAVAGVVAIGALTALIIAIGALVVGIGALMTEFPQIQEFLNTGIPVLEQLAYAIGSVVGNIIKGFSEAVASSLPVIGACLSQFMLNAMPFVNGVKMVDSAVLAGVGILAASIIALTAADLINGILSFIQGGSSFADLGTELSMFIANAMPFIQAAPLLSADMMGGVKAIAETILILTAADVLNGLTSWFTGGSSLSDFATQLPILGTGLRGFLDALGTFGEAEVTTVKCASDAVKTLASVASEIPNTGGLLASIVGDNQIGPFADQFPTLGTGLRGFIDNLGTFTEEQTTIVSCAAEAVKTLASASSEIPNTGGWLGAIVGENGLGAFAEDFPKLGEGLKGFVDNVGGEFNDAQSSTVTCAAECVKALATAAANIPNSGGWVAAIVGDNDLGTFGAQFPKLGEGLSGFIKKIGTFSTEQLTTVKTAILAVNAISDLSEKDASSLGDFGKKITDFAGKLASFCKKMADIGKDTLATAIYNVKQLAKMMNDISAVDANAGKKFSDSLTSLGENSIKSFVNAFSGETAISSVKEAVNKLINAAVNAVKDSKNKIKESFEDLIDNAMKGVKNKKSDVKKAFASLTEGAVDRLEDDYSDFKDAGKYLGEGFAKGIDAKLDRVKKAAAALAKAAAAALEAAAKIESPSKVTLADGEYFGEGFVLGIEEYASSSYKAGLGMADSAKKGLNASINKIQNYLAGDMDMQPTIRPVVDLSEVKTGINAIGGLFGDPSLAMAANVGAISSTMRDRGQNGGNDDVVSAIAKLGKKIEGMERNQYNFGDISTDGDSAVSSAVEELVRAIRMGRRT